MSRPAWINVGGQDLEGTATVTAATDTLTIPGHGLSNGDIVMVEDLSGGAVGPLIEGAVYFVRNVAGDDFQLSGTRGSQLKEFDTDGSADVLVAVPRYNAQALRLNDTVTLFHGSGDRLGAREGVRPGGAAVISVSGTDWTVHDHSGVVYPAITSTSGPYRYHQLEETDSLDPADGSSDRVDALDLLIEDHDEDATGFRRSRVVYVTGTPGGGEPAVTSNALRLGTILVPAGGSPSPSVESTAQFTVASGGVLPVEDDSALPTSGTYDGMAAWRRDTNQLVVANSSSSPTWDVVGSTSGFQFWQREIFFGDATFDLTNYPGARGALIKCQGGGGGGGGAPATSASQASAGTGGQGGNYSESFREWSAIETEAGGPSGTIAVTVGAGGNGGTGGDGGDGETSSFGSLVTAGGGSAGLAGGPSVGQGGQNPPVSNASGVGDLEFRGSVGNVSIHSGDEGRAFSGSGGSSYSGGGGRGRHSSASLGGADGQLRGGGGGGAANGNDESSATGGDGANGFVIVDIYV